jgi:hypothetical protein
MTVNVVQLTGADVDVTSYRIEFTVSSGCAFAVELQGQ